MYVCMYVCIMYVCKYVCMYVMYVNMYTCFFTEYLFSKMAEKLLAAAAVSKRKEIVPESSSESLKLKLKVIR